MTKSENLRSMLQWRPATQLIARAFVTVGCLLTLTLSILVGTSHAQVATGTISGQVQDAQGAAIPGANLKLTNIETANVTPAVSDGGESLFSARFRPADTICWSRLPDLPATPCRT